MMNIVSFIIDDTKAKVLASYEDTTAITKLDLDMLPEPEFIPGKRAELFINPATQELFYEYVNTPEGEKEQHITDLEMAMAAVLGGAV